MPELKMLLILIFAIVASIFFIWGTAIASVKHIGVGGIFLSISVICLLLFIR